MIPQQNMTSSCFIPSFSIIVLSLSLNITFIILHTQILQLSSHILPVTFVHDATNTDKRASRSSFKNITTEHREKMSSPAHSSFHLTKYNIINL